MLQEHLEYLKWMCYTVELESTQNHSGHAQSTACEFSEFHGKDKNTSRATGTCVNHFSTVKVVRYCSDGDKGVPREGGCCPAVVPFHNTEKRSTGNE